MALPTLSPLVRQIQQDPFDLLPRLRANIVPSEAESAQLVEYLNSLEGEISRVAKILEALNRQAAELAESHARCSSLLSPIRRLPEDVLSLIFGEAGNAIDIRCNSGANKVSAKASAYSGVCHHWHTIARNARRLWSNIAITSFDESHAKINAPVLDAILSMSNPAPLTLAVKLYDTTHIAATTSMRKRVMSLAPRLKSLTLSHNDSGHTLRPWFGDRHMPLTSTFPILHSLSLHCDMRVRYYDVTGFQNAPALRLLALSGVDFKHTALPWRQITHLTATVGDKLFSSLLCVFPGMTALAIFHLELNSSWDSGETQPLPPTATECSSVASMVINMYSFYKGSFTALKLLDFFRFPALTNLEITLARNACKEQTTLDHLVSFMERSECALTDLHLHQCPGQSEWNFEPLFSALPSLKRLSVEDFCGRVSSRTKSRKRDDPDALIEALTVGGSRGDNILLPALRDISLVIADGPLDALSDKAFLQFVNSRRRSQSATKLERVRLELKLRAVYKVSLPVIAHLEEGGLDITVTGKVVRKKTADLE